MLVLLFDTSSPEDGNSDRLTTPRGTDYGLPAVVVPNPLAPIGFPESNRCLAAFARASCGNAFDQAPLLALAPERDVPSPVFIMVLSGLRKGSHLGGIFLFRSSRGMFSELVRACFWVFLELSPWGRAPTGLIPRGVYPKPILYHSGGGGGGGLPSGPSCQGTARQNCEKGVLCRESLFETSCPHCPWGSTPKDIVPLPKGALQDHCLVPGIPCGLNP